MTPELLPYLASVGEPDNLRIQGLTGGRWQEFRTVVGTVGVITALFQGPPLAWPSKPSLVLCRLPRCGGSVGLGVLTALMRPQASVWRAAAKATLFEKNT